jgi:hypothetical protein
MADLYKTYNKTLKQLIDIISNELPNDPLTKSMNNIYVASVSTDRTIILTETGQELFKYRDYIAKNKWDELINKEWVNEIHSKSPENNHQSIQRLITLLKQLWNNYDESEKNEIKQLIRILLTTYTKYLMQK